MNLPNLYILPRTILGNFFVAILGSGVHSSILIEIKLPLKLDEKGRGQIKKKKKKKEKKATCKTAAELAVKK